MTGLAGTSDPYVTVKYIEQDVDSCDRGTIIGAVYAAIAPANPARLIVVQNQRNPVCPGMADSSGTVIMVWDLDALNPHVLFHKLGITYHTHYYVEFTQRRSNTAAGGLYNYIVTRSASDHRAKRSRITRFMAAISSDDTAVGIVFFDYYNQIGITFLSIDSSGAEVLIATETRYTLPSNVNQCYYSGIIDSQSAVAVNNNICRGLSRNNHPSSGTFKGTHCLIPNSGVGHIVAAPNLEYLHCLNTPNSISTSQSTMQDSFYFWDESDMLVCNITYENVLYHGSGHFGKCCFYYNNGEKCIWNDPSTVYLSWIS
ncbi:hypothetical protein LPJ53_005708 [Coemansia erecta]|uniref:Uncharacterized protein n=1 Tax=Coemansia erecta TaxID=147472 RepID=A0A9W7XRW9_9FUNG|nr:hypothetical protein LPJ53_005708 [Coemansia erecta]